MRDPRAEIRALARERPVVVLDDDATGSQAVRDVEVLTRATPAELAERLRSGGAGFFVLTNSRSLDAGAATDLAWETGRRLREAAKEAGRPVSLVSRSDSTLRGHFPAEVDALAAGFGMRGPRIVLAPFFGEGGRITRDDVHSLVRDGRATPVAETEFAADPVFGYRSSNLLDWVAEKAPGRPVRSVGLAALRATDGAAVRDALAASPAGGVCVVNAVEQRDIELAALGALRAELDGVEVVARTAASYARARLGQPVHRPIEPPAGATPGLVVVGSHVPLSTLQLERVLGEPPIPLETIELDVDRLVGEPGAADVLVERAARRADEALARGITPVVATSRRLRRGADPREDLAVAAAASRALVATVAAIARRPAWIVAKGGITSSDVAVHGLGAASATVVGQLAPGISAWRLGPGSRFPGLLYVVFPGNVGDPDSLRAACALLAGVSRRPASGGPR